MPEVFYERPVPDFVGKVISARNSETGIPLDGRLDPETRAIRMANYVFIPDNGLGSTIGEWKAMGSPSMVFGGKVTATFEALETIMNRLLKEAMKTNLYLSLLTETELTDEHVEV